MHSRPEPSTGLRSAPQPVRRGNTLVLVMAILVLLVIVATAFVSRTQSGRQTSSAQQSATQRDQRSESLAEDLSDSLAAALFPQPVDPNALLPGFGGGAGVGFRTSPNDPNVFTVTSSFPRLATVADARPFGIDRDVDGDLLPDFAYNYAPFEVRPWTNWPDFLSPAFPAGPGQPNGSVVGPTNAPIGDGNPLGNPGFGDARWLRSTEPVRVDTTNDGVPDAFSHWAHLSWLPTANNGYRVVPNIKDLGTVLTSTNEADFTTAFALGMPYEQWLPNVPPAGVGNAGQFRARRDGWFAAPTAAGSYANTYATPNAMPNLFRLADLPADLRAAVEETLADTDGDGFTDSLWFLAPSSMDRSIRTIVAVSVIDNAGLLNVNTATRFNRRTTRGVSPSDLALVGDPDTPGRQVGFFDNPAHSYPDAGATDPSLYFANDVSNQLFAPAFIAWTRDRFGDASLDSLTFLQAIGMKDSVGAVNPFIADATWLPANERGEFYAPVERLRYFKSGALGGAPALGLVPAAIANGVGVDPVVYPNLIDASESLTPFEMPDELELRAFQGQNSPWQFSRLERSMNTTANTFSFLRSTPQRPETSPYLAQLTNRQLLLDNRRKMTTVGGARNDLLPAWLWPTPFADPRVDYNRDGQTADTDGNPATIENPAAGDLDFIAYVRQTSKIDLRRAMDDPAAGSNAVPAATTVEENRRQWRIDVQNVLERVLTRTWPLTGGGARYQSYLGRSDDQDAAYQRQQFDKTRQMVASMTANIDQYRDSPIVFTVGPNVIPLDAPLHPALAVQDPIEPDLRYIGQERQPFITEVFAATVYPKSAVDPQLKAALIAAGVSVPNDLVIPSIFPGGGEKFVDSSSKPSVVIAVQIANPYDTPIPLFDFRLRVFGKSYNFATSPNGPAVTLGPATERGPTTAIVYAIKDSPGADAPPVTFPFVGTWLDFMDIEATELFNPAGDPQAQTLVFDASGSWLSFNVPSPAVDQTNPLNDPNGVSVELVRVIGPQAGPGANLPSSVVVDRFDNTVSGPQLKFAETFSRLFTDDSYYPPVQDYDFDPTNPPDRNWMNSIRLGSDDYLVAWVRASRPWRWDVWLPNTQLGDGAITPLESNPRYVFSAGSKPFLVTKSKDGTIGGADRVFKGDTYAIDQDPDGSNLWISYSYRDMLGGDRRGKPTLFPMVTRTTPGSQDNVYGQGFPYPDAAGNWPANVLVGDKGLQAEDWQKLNQIEALRGPFQVLQKDADIAQVGELLNVFCWGPVIDIGAGIATPTTERTLGEILLQAKDDTDQPAGRGLFVNRLRMTPFRAQDELGQPLDGTSPTDGPTPILSTPPTAPYVPALAAGSGLFDAFVCDDRGAQRFDTDLDGTIELFERDAAEARRLRNAAGYAGALTPGLVNVNTALMETMRSLPQMARLCHNDDDFGTVTGGSNQILINPVANPFTRVVDSLLRYRDRTTLGVSGTIAPAVPNPNLLPGYVDRGLAQNAIPGTNGFLGAVTDNGITVEGLRSDRGIVSIGELALLQRFLDDPALDQWNLERSFSIEFAGLDPYRSSESNPLASGVGAFNGVAYRLSTDLTEGRSTANPNQTVPAPVTIPDSVAGDAEERNLLLSGLSSMVTTRGDVFTVWFRTRSVKQDSATGKWDATRDDLVVDDSRFVMVVDRSGVKRPGDKPKILLLERVDSPN